MNIPHETDDIVALVRRDHTRVRDLFAELDAAGNRPARLSALWTELSGVLLAHLGAAKEICYLPLVDGALGRSPTIGELSAYKEDVSEAVADARLHEPGSPSWWLAVRAARDAAFRHFRYVESGPLPELRRRVPQHSRQALGRQWTRFMSDLLRDSRGEKYVVPRLFS